MKTLTVIATAALLSLSSFGAFATTSTASTTNGEPLFNQAEAQIAAQAKKLGIDTFKVIEARSANSLNMMAFINREPQTE